ncbi:thioredoxin family protein [Capillimicrobium parvum]|uniref:Thioredoxin n=1 Tax=Capillimicrobium parvum TaxID=2884022 RepID=A0A9E7C2E3_9ACTN|nr:thioredoxin family protein [Capillimicrobium parvum]UGS37363.1 hypothetical protein DSM104329_03778 [Capillimicrobium parvum]
MELVALVKHDCPVCDQVLPALDAAGVRVLSQSEADDTAAQAARLGLRAVPELDDELALSARLDLEAVPALVLLDGEAETARVEGLHRARYAQIAERAGVHIALDGLPEMRPGCASRTREPEVAARLAARAARRAGRLRARELTVGELEDPFEALFERGVTDGLPVIPPTAERVVEMLDATSRDAQDVVGVVPPYDGEATVEKVAINAVMAGCPPEAFPVVLAAVHAACRPEFALHGVVATTHPAGPTIVVSGPLAAEIGMNAEGNCLGQGNRANLTIGRALGLVVRNVGGGRPREEDRAAHGQPGKLASCFAERTWDSPFSPLHVARGLDAEETGVTVMATEAPRIVVDQLAREPDALARSLASGLEAVAHVRQRLAWDALLVVGPEHGRVFAGAGWSRERLQEELFARTMAPARSLVRGAGGIAEGLDPAWVDDPDQAVAKFAAPDRIVVAHAGGDAGLFSMVYGSWVGGEAGSVPVTEAVSPWR